MIKAFYLLGLSFLFFYINTNTHVDVLGNNQVQKNSSLIGAYVFLFGSIINAIIALN